MASAVTGEPATVHANNKHALQGTDAIELVRTQRFKKLV